MKRETESLRLMEAVLEGNATESDRLAFNAVCRKDAAFRRAYIRQATIHSLALDDAAAMEVVFPPRRAAHRLVRFAAAAAAVALLSGFVIAALVRSSSQSVPLPADAVSQPVARPASAPVAVRAGTPVAVTVPVPAVTNGSVPSVASAPVAVQTPVQEKTKGMSEVKTKETVAAVAASLSFAAPVAIPAETVLIDSGGYLDSPVHMIETRSADAMDSPAHTLDTVSPIGTIYRFI